MEQDFPTEIQIQIHVQYHKVEAAALSSTYVQMNYNTQTENAGIGISHFCQKLKHFWS